MIRLDKFLCEMQVGTRSEVKNLIRKGNVLVNDQTVKTAEQKIDEKRDRISLYGKPLVYKKHVYIILNKPSGIISATRDNREETVLDWIRNKEPENLYLQRELPPVGRLDKDTEGLLILTDDGSLSHRLLSPARHVEKTYYVELKYQLTEQNLKQLESGVDIGEEELTMPAYTEPSVSSCYHSPEAVSSCFLTITEGKFHQVKRMMQAVGNEVVYLKRVRMGGLILDESLAKGDFRELTPEEIQLLESDHLNKIKR